MQYHYHDNNAIRLIQEISDDPPYFEVENRDEKVGCEMVVRPELEVVVEQVQYDNCYQKCSCGPRNEANLLYEGLVLLGAHYLLY